MQTDVKAEKRPFEPQFLKNVFPGLKIHVKGNVSRVHVDVLNGGDLLNLIGIYLDCRVDLFLSRYNKGITIKVTRHPDNYEGAVVLKTIPLEIA